MRQLPDNDAVNNGGQVTAKKGKKGGKLDKKTAANGKVAVGSMTFNAPAKHYFLYHSVYPHYRQTLMQPFAYSSLYSSSPPPPPPRL